jgi:hypothetical protein
MGPLGDDRFTASGLALEAMRPSRISRRAWYLRLTMDSNAKAALGWIRKGDANKAALRSREAFHAARRALAMTGYDV